MESEHVLAQNSSKRIHEFSLIGVIYIAWHFEQIPLDVKKLL